MWFCPIRGGFRGLAGAGIARLSEPRITLIFADGL